MIPNRDINLPCTVREYAEQAKCCQTTVREAIADGFLEVDPKAMVGGIAR
jgi:hypothetical protein